MAGAYSIYEPGHPVHQPSTPNPAVVAAVQFEHRHHRDTIETGAFFALDGSMVISKAGSHDQVSFAQSELAGTRGCVFTHNHPRDGTLSPSDVSCAIDSDLAEIRAVGPKLRHRMWAPNGWPAYADILRELSAAVASVNLQVSQMIKTGRLHPQFALQEADHQGWVKVCSVLRLYYIRERGWR